MSDRRSLHEILNCSTDRGYCRRIGQWLAATGGWLVVVVWGIPRVPWALPAQVLFWIGGASTVCCAVAALVQLSGYCSYLLRIGRDRRQSAALRLELARAARRPLREAIRALSEQLETDYSFVLSMDPLEAQKRALLWYEQIVSKWEKENRLWCELRKDDAWDEVLAELGPRADRMLAIWNRRRALFQYAVAYSTEAMRAKEILAIEREIQQLQVEEARAKRNFEDELNRIADRDESEENSLCPR